MAVASLHSQQCRRVPVKGILNGAKRREGSSYSGQVSTSLLNYCATDWALTAGQAFDTSPRGDDSAQRYSESRGHSKPFVRIAKSLEVLSLSLTPLLDSSLSAQQLPKALMFFLTFKALLWTPGCPRVPPSHTQPPRLLHLITNGGQSFFEIDDRQVLRRISV